MRTVLLVMVLLGCRPKEPPLECIRAGSRSEVPLFELGVPYEAVIGKEESITCYGLELSFRAELIDPNNLPVDGVAWTLVDDPLQNLAVKLAFTPTGPGPYHYRVQFEPNLGVQQGEIARGVRRARPVLQTLPYSFTRSCDRWHVTSHGTVICSAGSQVLEAMRTDGVTQTIQFAQFVNHITFGEDSVWVTTGGSFTDATASPGLQRWVDDGSKLVAQPADALMLQPTATALTAVRAASETEGFMVELDRVIRFPLDGGGWGPIETFTVPQAVPNIEPGATPPPGCMSSDGGWWWLVGRTLYCQNPVRADGGQRCFPAPGIPITVEPDGVWFRGIGALGFLDDEGRVATLAFSTTAKNFPLSNIDKIPVFKSGNDLVYIARERDGGLTYELLDGGYLTGWVQDDRLYLISDGGVTVMPR